MTQPTLTSRTVHGLKWSVVGQILNAATTVATIAVLARLLHPAAFGLAAMGLVIMRFVTYFAQMGVGAALVQKPEVTHDDVRAGFTSSMLLGVAACVVVIAAAPLATILFPHPQVVPVVRVMAIDFVLNGATITSFALLRRKLAFKALAVADTLTYIVGYGAVSIVLAALGFGVWSLVIGALAQGALTVVAYYALTLHSVKPLFRWSVYRTLYSYGARISIIQFLEFFTYNMDTMWAGHFFSTADLGIYTRSFTLVSLPNQYVATSFTRVLFPAFSRIQTERERLKNAYLPAITVAAIIGVPLMWGIAAASPQVVQTILGARWHAAIPIVAILATAMPFTLLANFSGIVCDATARLNAKIVIRSSQIILVLCFFAALTRFGIAGVATGYALGQVFVASAFLFVLKGIFHVGLPELLRAYTPGAAAGICAAALIVALGVAGTLVHAPVAATLVAQIVVGTAVVLRWMLRSRHGAAWREIRLRLLGTMDEPATGRMAPIVRWLDRHSAGRAERTAEPETATP